MKGGENQIHHGRGKENNNEEGKKNKEDYFRYADRDSHSWNGDNSRGRAFHLARGQTASPDQLGRSERRDYTLGISTA